MTGLFDSFLLEAMHAHCRKLENNIRGKKGIENRVNHCEHIGSETFSYKTEYVYRFKENKSDSIFYVSWEVSSWLFS